MDGILLLMLRLFTLCPLPPPVPLELLEDGDDEELQVVIVMLNLLALLCPPPLVPHQLLNIAYRITPDDVARRAPWHGSDVFQIMAPHRLEFWNCVGETPETFLEIVARVQIVIEPFQGRQPRLSPRNKVLLTLLWLRLYPTYMFLSQLFNIGKSTVGEVVHQIWPILWEHFGPEIQWPGVDVWRAMRGAWPEVPFAVGALDGTSHQIYRPSNEDQREYYSGHRHRHVMHTVVVIGNDMRFKYISAGYLGHSNDARCFQLMPSIGPDGELPFPDDCFLLADLAYANEYPLVTPFSQAQVRAAPHRAEINVTLRKHRIYVEHLIKHIKTFRVVGSLYYRHSRRRIAQIVELAAGLAQRRLKLFDSLGE